MEDQLISRKIVYLMKSNQNILKYLLPNIKNYDSWKKSLTRSSLSLFVCLCQQPGKIPLTKCIYIYMLTYVLYININIHVFILWEVPSLLLLLSNYKPSYSTKSFPVIYRQILISIWKAFYWVFGTKSSFLCSPWSKFMKWLLVGIWVRLLGLMYTGFNW